MAGNRMGGSYGDPDDLDEYWRDEFRAEHGAYQERRPFYYSGYDDGEGPADYWGPRIPASATAFDEGFARAGTGAPLDRPLPYESEYYQDETALRYMRHDEPEHVRYHRRPAADRDEGRHHPQHGRNGGRRLMHAAEHFYENLAGSLGLDPDADTGLGHRGRGPRNYTRSDERILDDVSMRLMDDPFLDASDIEVKVRNREVTFSGTVASRFAKRHAEDIADAVPGVTHVQNNLRIGAGTSEPAKPERSR